MGFRDPSPAIWGNNTKLERYVDVLRMIPLATISTSPRYVNIDESLAEQNYTVQSNYLSRSTIARCLFLLCRNRGSSEFYTGSKNAPSP